LTFQEQHWIVNSKSMKKKEKGNNYRCLNPQTTCNWK